ncbi:MAG: heavy metal translocating P-type ATPase [Bifidobacteriaceae bacterium]|jgi:Cu+-exporting ATPase|nr:heavy metal translocating P-type ATPase [Bifidobacteriaceae bacterium]
MSTAIQPRQADGSDRVAYDFAIGGMTCASCAARIEKKIAKLPGASAAVNLPLETAHVTGPPSLSAAAIIKAVESAGYTARPLPNQSSPGDSSKGVDDAAPRPGTTSGPSSVGSGDDQSPTVPAPRNTGLRQTPTRVPSAGEREGATGSMGTRTAMEPGSPGAAAGSALAMGGMGDGGSMEPMGGMDSMDAMDAMDVATAPGQDRDQVLRQRLIVGAILAVPVLVLSMVPALQFPGWQWLVAPLATVVAVWCAWPFHAAALRAVRHLTSTMDTLVSVGVIASTLWSWWALVFGGAGEIGMRMHFTLIPSQAAGRHGMPELYFESAAVITVFLLAGKLMEFKSKKRAGNALRDLLDMGAKEVTLVEGPPDARTERTVPISQLRVGQEFRVRPGQKIATDGVVTEGDSAVDTSLLTGEAAPVDVGPGDSVTGATINASGSLIVRATAVGAQTRLAAIGRLVAAAQTGKAPIQRLADRISAWFVPIVLLVALATLVGWLLAGAGTEAAFMSASAVLIIACPCALGLATPTAILVGTGRGARMGILIKGPEVLESTRRITTIVLDKTGTVTEGKMHLVEVLAPRVDGRATARPTALAVAGAVETPSEHPIAVAVAAAARAAGTIPELTGFASEPGGGASGTVALPGAQPSLAAVGKPSYLRSLDLAIAPEVEEAYEAGAESGGTAVLVGWTGEARAVLLLRDEPKADAASGIGQLKALGVRPWLVTGDSKGAALVAARQVGIAAEDVRAQVPPEGKVKVVRGLQAAGQVVAMVGDGVNDAAAIAAADLGLAMGSGTDVANHAADITLMRNQVTAIPAAIRLSRATLRVIKQNLFWAFAYNVAMVPLAVAGLASPMLAGAAMAFSSVIVVGNSLRLNRVKI